MIQNERIKCINEGAVNSSGRYILYWMQASIRVLNNHALEYAVQMSNQLDLPLLVAFVVMPSYPGATTGHYRFMLEGMDGLMQQIEALGAQFTLCTGGFDETIGRLLPDASAVVMDVGYTKHQRLMRTYVGDHFSTPAYTVETNIIVPVETAYPKEAYAAYALRSKLMKQVPHFAISFSQTYVKNKTTINTFQEFEKMKWEGTEKLISQYLNQVEPYQYAEPLKGGEDEALKVLEAFVSQTLEDYDISSNHPEREGTSKLSAYLHFGQISPITVYEAVNQLPHKSAGFIEQLVVRRELSYNFTWYNPDYDGNLVDMLPKWALETLSHHANDPRPYLYTLEALESANTHDVYWNTAQKQMMRTGFMHNYMRMYWGKKIVEWSACYEDAHKAMLYLNDKYELDGRDPNGYAGIAWCFGKFDRPFSERMVFGKVRYMNAQGLKRKFEMDKWVERYNK